MILNWILSFDKIDKDTMQEVRTESKHGIYHRGKIIKLCSVCEKWVSKEDYKDFCLKSMHEYSIPENIEKREYKDVQAKV